MYIMRHSYNRDLRSSAPSEGAAIPVFRWLCGIVLVQPWVSCWREDEVESRSTSSRLCNTIEDKQLSHQKRVLKNEEAASRGTIVTSACSSIYTCNGHGKRSDLFRHSPRNTSMETHARLVCILLQRDLHRVVLSGAYGACQTLNCTTDILPRRTRIPPTLRGSVVLPVQYTSEDIPRPANNDALQNGPAGSDGQMERRTTAIEC